jgi:glycosyltransferase involved in cell wall biosynthesis
MNNGDHQGMRRLHLGRSPEEHDGGYLHTNGSNGTNGVNGNGKGGRHLHGPHDRWHANGKGQHGNGRHEPPVLAMFCFENHASRVGGFLEQLTAALAERPMKLHLFSRRGFELAAPGVTIHVIGETHSSDTLSRVQEFASRACNTFLKLFPATSTPITLLGFEWSAIPVLSLLHGIRNLSVLLSLHALECRRGEMASELSKQIEEIEATGLRTARSILVHDPETAEAARSLAPDCSDRIVPIRTIFPVEDFHTAMEPDQVKAQYQIGPADPTILFIGNVSEGYGADLLVKAMPRVLKKHPQARLIVVGDGSEYWPLRVYCRYLLLDQAVRLPGSIEGAPVYELIQAADVIAVPSRESTPWWPIQAAWAARRPLLATAAAAPDLLEPDYDCMLVEPSEVGCAAGIDGLLSDPELSRAIAERGREKLERLFGWNGIAAQVEDLMASPRNWSAVPVLAAE